MKRGRSSIGRHLLLAGGGGRGYHRHPLFGNRTNGNPLPPARPTGRTGASADATGPIQSYSYLGLDTPVTFTDGNGTELTYLSTTGSTGDAGDQVTGLDRFGRVVDQNWVNSSGTSIDEEKYTYDQDSNVLSRDDTVVPSQSELYTYDGLNRLATFARGTLNGTNTAITGTAGTTESWSLDALGNWQSNTVNGTTTSRTNSAQNQVSTVTPSGGTAATLRYDADGNTTTDQTGQQYVYDAWNRMVTVKSSGGTTTAAYTYDAQGRRVTETDGNTTTDLYYSKDWQVLQEGTSAQYVWSPYDVDGLIERDDHDPSTTGTSLNRRLYAEQDANDNVTSLTNSAGAVVERYAYDPYGAVTVENPDGTTRGTGAASASYYGSVYLYQGMRLDVVTGTYDGKRRVYDVDLERWLQPDPAGYVDGPDTYQDELSSPADGTDPTGLAFVPSSGAASDELNPFTGGGPSADPGETAAVLGDPAVNGFGTSGGGPTPGAVTSAAQTAPAGPITLLGTTTSRYLPLSGAADPCPFGLGPEQDASTEEASGPNDPQVLLYEAQAYDASHPYAVPDERSTLYQVTTYLALATGQGSAQGLLDNPGVQDALAWSQDAVTGANQFGLAAVDAVDTFGFLIDPELLGIEGIEGIEVNTLGCFRAGTAVRSGTGERHPIERVGIGRRVATPEQSADRPGRRVDPAAQRVVRLHVVKDGQQLRLAFLRPAALVGHLSAGDTVHLDIFELQVKGPARVVGVDPCPPLAEGPGRLVTGTAVSDSVDVLRVKLAGLADPLEVTGNHPVFSEDHQDFVSAKVLRPGDRLRTADGAGTVVEAVERLVGRWDVYNLEVDGAHQYYVTGLDVLVHNAEGNGLYQTGTYNQLRYTSVEDTIVHHVPSRLRGNELIPDYGLTLNGGADEMAGREFGIRLPRSEAEAVDTAALSRTEVPASARQELAWQIQDLRNYTESPNTSLQELIDLNRNRRPWDFNVRGN